MPMCCVAKCKTMKGFSFPKDPVIRQKWIEAVRRESTFVIKPWTIVCGDHFTREDFVREGYHTGVILTSRRLRKGAVPSVFSWNQNGNLPELSVHRVNPQKPIVPNLVPLKTYTIPQPTNYLIFEPICELKEGPGDLTWGGNSFVRSPTVPSKKSTNVRKLAEAPKRSRPAAAAKTLDGASSSDEEFFMHEPICEITMTEAAE